MFPLTKSITHPFVTHTVFGIEGHTVLCLAKDLNLVLKGFGVPFRRDYQLSSTLLPLLLGHSAGLRVPGSLQ